MNATAEKFLTALHLNRPWQFLKATAAKWNEDKCPTLGAALAYYTVFSLAPLMLVLLAVFGLIYGNTEAARDKITRQLGYFVDKSTVEVIKSIASNAAKPSKGILATVAGVVIALFGASGVFGQLQDALNTVWGVKPKPGGGIWGFVKTRFLSYAMVGGVCFLLLVSLTLSSVVHLFSDQMKHSMPGGDTVPLLINLLLDLVVVTLLFVLIFKYLPDAKIAWRDVWIGAAITTLLFLVGKVGTESVSRQRQRGECLRSSQRADHHAAQGVLLWTNHALRRGVHPDLCHGVRLARCPGGRRGESGGPEDGGDAARLKTVASSSRRLGDRIF